MATLQTPNSPLPPPEVNIVVTPSGSPIQIASNIGTFEWPDLYQGLTTSGNGNLAGYITPYIGSQAGGLLVGGPTYRTYAHGTTLTFSGSVNYPPPLNQMPDPSFEQETVGAAPQYWSYAGGVGTTNTVLAIQSGWASQGTQSLRTTITFSGVSNASGAIATHTPSQGFGALPILPNISYGCSVTVNILSVPTSFTDLYLTVNGYSSTPNSIPTVSYSAGGSAPSTTGIYTLTFPSFIFPSNIAFGGIQINGVGNGSGSLDFYTDNVKFFLNTPASPAILSQQWSFGDGSTATGPVVTHTYQNAYINAQAVLAVAFANGQTTYTPKQMNLT